MFFALAAACGGDDGPPDPGEAWVMLGTGTTEFRTLSTDQELILEAGPQGGHHFIVHARIFDLLPGDPAMPGQIGNPSTSFTVSDPGGNRLDVNQAPYRLGYEPIENGVFELPSGRILQVQEDLVESLYGQRVLIEVSVTDASGVEVTDERWVIATEQPLPDGGPPTGDAGL